MRVEVVRPDQLSEADVTAWRAIQAGRTALMSPFLSPDWARAVDRAAGPDQVRVAVVRDGDEPRAFFAARCGRLTALPVGAPANDVQAVVAPEGFALDPAVLLRALGVHRYDFSHMAAEDPVFGASARGCQDSFIVELSEGWEAYAASRREAGTDILKDMAKKRRKLEREFGPVSFTPMSRSRSDFETLLAWKSDNYRRTRQTDVLAAPWVRRLLDELFESRDPGFGGALFTLHVGDRLAAAQFNLRGPDEINAWFIAHDHHFERCSPGLVLFHDLMEWMAGGPFRRLELGPVAYQFKERLANRRRRIAYGFAGLPSPVTLIRAAQYGVRSAAERLPLGRASHWPGKAMRRLDLWRGLG